MSSEAPAPLPALVNVNINNDGTFTATFSLNGVANNTLILPTYNLPAGLYHSEGIQRRKKKNLLHFANAVHLIGAVLGLCSGRVKDSPNPGFPFAQLGTAIYFLASPLMLFAWLLLTTLPFFSRTKRAGSGSIRTIGYTFIATQLSFLWYAIPFAIAFIMFASVADKAFSGEEGKSGTKVTAFIIALIQISMVGVLESNYVTFQSGMTMTPEGVSLPACVMEHGVQGGTIVLTDEVGFKWSEVEALAGAVSSESFKTVRTSTSGNTTTTTTRTWTRNVLWVCFKLVGKNSVVGFPVSAVNPPACGGYCCLTLERLQELGVIRTHAKTMLDAVEKQCPHVTAQATELRRLIDATVKI